MWHSRPAKILILWPRPATTGIRWPERRSSCVYYFSFCHHGKIYGPIVLKASNFAPYRAVKQRSLKRGAKRQ